MTTQSSPRWARLAGVLGGLICGTVAGAGAAHLASYGAGPRVIFRPLLWFLLIAGGTGYAIERWVLAQPLVGRIVVIAFIGIAPFALYRIMFMFGLVMALGVLVVLAVVVSLIVVSTKKT